MKGVFQFFASLKLAVFSILSLAAVLAAGTITESFYGMRAAHLMVYGTWWFGGVLFLLGTNVFCAALSRYPWEKRQMGFVITHTGILTMLLGSFLTQQLGVDGNLPVVENSEEHNVILNDLSLTVFDEDNNLSREFPIPETGKASRGRLLEVATRDNRRLVLDEFLPRASFERDVQPSPLKSVGLAAIKVEVFNSRFRLEQWLFHNHPGKNTEINLGPAVLSFAKLWSPSDEQKFLAKTASIPTGGGIGFLIVEQGGRQFRVKIDEAMHGWRRLGNLQLKVERYFPYAVVENNKLVSRSNKPVNPAVEIVVKDGKGNEEKHTVFAQFPQFATLHRAHHGQAKASLGLHIRMLAGKTDDQSLAIVGTNRGQLQFAQSADDNRLLYRVKAASGTVNREGEVKVGEVVQTGWMDLNFKVSQWHSSATEEEVPHYVEYISGAENNYLSGIHLKVESGRGLSSDSDPKGVWVSEGSSVSLPGSGNHLIANFGKTKLTLPFSLYLEKFTVGMDPGTAKAATYESRVLVKDNVHGVEKRALISMNEPMVYGGYTFYQASYQMEDGKPTVSIFAVNKDPGRPVKYAGAICMVIGILLMFYMNPHYWDKILQRRKA